MKIYISGAQPSNRWRWAPETKSATLELNHLDQMDAYETRLASFAPKKSSRSKKQQAASSGWPHPPTFRATPSRLALAGFYFEPSTSKPDNVLCFMCGYALGNWEEQDDPFKVHIEHSPKCAWAIARCSIEDDKRGDKYVLRPS